LRGDSSQGIETGKAVTRKTQDRIGTGGQWAAGSTSDGVLTTVVTSKWHKGTGGPSGSEHYNLVVEPVTFSKSRRAQSSTDVETWVESDVTPTLNVFDVGDTRATTAIIEPVLAFDTQFGSNANVFEDQSPTLKSSQQSPSVTQESPMLIDGRRVDDVRVYTEPVQTLQERMDTGGNNVPVVAQETPPTLVVRRLTPLECERLMGWPDNHTTIGTNGPISDTQRFKMCGNGVASPVATWIAGHLPAPTLNG
jgi:site-specific DNA-cytosine methylase